LRDDLAGQRKIAEQALEEAKRLDTTLKTTEDSKAKEELERAKATLINIARELAANATHTSSAATITFFNTVVAK
jgi:hypothetical protein